MLETKQLTVEEFEKFAAAPENADKTLEFVGGRIVEEVSNNYSSLLASFLNTMINLFVLQHQLGYVTSSDGGYAVGAERYIPDTAFVSIARQSEPSLASYLPFAPDLAVEVLSPSNEDREIRIKVVNYLRAGALIWVVDPESKTVEVYTPDEAPKTLGVNDLLDGGTVLPGFSLSIRNLFDLKMNM